MTLTSLMPPGRRRTWRSLVHVGLATALATTWLVATGGPSHAYTQSQRDEQKRYAIETMNMSYSQFIQRKSDFQNAICRNDDPTYLHNGTPVPGCTKPAPYNAFNWTDDGCSGLPGISLTYRNLFNQPCQLHDFGYRNFGHGLQLDRTEDRRAWVDQRFLGEMNRLCTTKYTGFRRTVCLDTASWMWTAVRNGALNQNWSGSDSIPAPTVEPDPAPAPVPPPPPLLKIFTVMNTSESLPDGVWFRDSAHNADTERITGLGIYANEQIRARCYAFGDAVGSYGNRVWYLVDNLSRPTVAGRPDSGYLNTHYVEDGMSANQPAPGVPAC